MDDDVLQSRVLAQVVADLLHTQLPQGFGFLLLVHRVDANDGPNEESGYACTSEDEETVDAILRCYQRTRRSVEADGDTAKARMH